MTDCYRGNPQTSAFLRYVSTMNFSIERIITLSQEKNMQRLFIFLLAFLASIALLASLSACGIPERGSSSPSLSPSPILSPSLSASLFGPETTPISPRPYPSILTVETANTGMVSVVDAPPSITGLADVQAIIAKHTQLAQDAGLSFDHMAVKYVAAEQRWFLVPVASDGTTIAGWLEIADATSQSGWRFGEQPTWDSQYHPSTDTYQYGLPSLHDSANHFQLGYNNGFPILIEVTATGIPQYWNNIEQKTTLLVEGAVLPTETPVGPAIPQEVADKYPQGINIEYVGTDRLPLANDASSGNLIGWYSKKDSAWHFADEGMQMKYIENFDILGPAVTTEVVKTEDITAQTLTDWEAGIHLPGEIIVGEVTDNPYDVCPSQGIILENLVLTDFIDERVTLNPGLAAQTGHDRVWFNFAFRKNSISHTLKIETRGWFAYLGTSWHIDSQEQEIISKFELGKKFYVAFSVIRPESECTNKQLLALPAPTSMDPLMWRFVIGRSGDIKLSIEELKALLFDRNEVIITHDQAWIGGVSPYNRPP